jgi:exopolysaccharide biosynthesis polyprenyl glycosylphosphotransferase
MISVRSKGARAFRAVCTIATSLIVFWAWMWLYFQLTNTTPISPGLYVVYSLIITIGVVMERGGKRSVTPTVFGLASVTVAMRQTLMGVGLLLAYLFITQDTSCSRAFLLTLVPLLYTALLISNIVICPWLLRSMMGGRQLQHTVLVGPASMINRHLEWIERRREQGIQIIGYISTDDEGTEEPQMADIRRLGALAELDDVLNLTRPALAIFMDGAGWSDQIAEHKAACDRCGVRYLLVWDFTSTTPLVPDIAGEDGLHLLSFRAEPLQDPVNRMIKRGLDILVSVPVILFILPVLSAFVWILHRRQSPGPLFFRQLRTGLHGEHFWIIKFRTMHLDHGDEARQAVAGDKRVFPAGSWLRKLSLDEFPQFINVLFGEMSVIGPRPHLPAHDEEFAFHADDYRVRTFVKPGITGLAQVRGFRGLVEAPKDVHDRLTSDLFYLENWSPLLDLTILICTLRDVIWSPKSAV